MRILHYTAVFIKNMAAKKTSMLILIFVSEVIAVLCLFFSYGLFMNTMRDVGQVEEDSFYYLYSFKFSDGDETGLKAGLENFMEYLGDDLRELDISYYTHTESGEQVRAESFYYSDTEAAIKDGEARIAAEQKDFVRDGFITLDGEKYKVVKDYSEAGKVILPISAIKQKSCPYDLLIGLGSTPTKAKVAEINDKAAELLGAVSYVSPKPQDLMRYQLDNTFYLYSFIITLIVLLDLSMYFRYILSLRRKMIKVFTFCGAGRGEISLIFIFENLTGLALAFLLALLIFKGRLLSVFEGFYPEISGYFGSGIYFKTFLLYMAASVIVLIVTVIPSVTKAASAGERSERI